MNDLTKLKEMAERASVGDWSFSPCIADKHFLGQVWCADGESLCIMDHMTEQANADGAFIAAANPQAILGLIAELERLRSQVVPLARGAEQAMEERDRLKADNEALRKIISECATACGAGCHQECSLEFMAMLPDEIASVVGKRARNAAIGAVVWQFIDRMPDVCEQDPAERILEQFVAAVRPAIDAALEGGGR